MPVLFGHPYTRGDLLRRVGSIDQLASAEAYELTEGNQRGVRLVRLQNAAGLDLSAALDRGMSITALRWQGIPIPFSTAAGTVHPAFGIPWGADWLRTWPAGFLTTCGLSQVGSPGVDNGEQLGVHGQAAGIPARAVSWGGEWRGDDYILWVQGSVRETAMFGHTLELTRRIETSLGQNGFMLRDRVENLGFEPAPHMFLQHINLGFPLLDEHARLELPEHTVEARDEDARPGLNSYTEFQKPTPGYREQVFYHTLKPDAVGMVEVRLVNPSFGGGRGLSLALRYAVSDYPILVEWKQMGEGAYVLGLEPANCHVEGRTAERARGTLRMLEPGEVVNTCLEVRFA